jgi:hypothetical protein
MRHRSFASVLPNEQADHYRCPEREGAVRSVVGFAKLLPFTVFSELPVHFPSFGLFSRVRSDDLWTGAWKKRETGFEEPRIGRRHDTVPVPGTTVFARTLYTRPNKLGLKYNLSDT